MKCPRCENPNNDNYYYGFCDECIRIFIKDILAPNRNDPKPDKKDFKCLECGREFKRSPEQSCSSIGVRCPGCGAVVV